MPDYMYMLESRLSAEQRAAMMRVQELAAEAGSNLYLTGGAVRDLVSGMPIRDLDFTIEGNPSRLAHEAEKGGAQIVSEDEKLRQIELIFAGNVDGSISAAREDVYARPGNALGDSLVDDHGGSAPARFLHQRHRAFFERGLARLAARSHQRTGRRRKEAKCARYRFTASPISRCGCCALIRYAARMDFKLESRTEEWFALAMERGLAESIAPEDVGRELRQLGREEKPAAILKAWEARGLIGTIHPQLARRHPDYEMLRPHHVARATKSWPPDLRPRLLGAGYRGGAGAAEAARSSLRPFRSSDFRSSEVERRAGSGRRGAEGRRRSLPAARPQRPSEAYAFLEQTPPHLIVFLMAESSNSKAVEQDSQLPHQVEAAAPGAAGRQRQNWRRWASRAGRSSTKWWKSLFRLQLAGKGRTPGGSHQAFAETCRHQGRAEERKKRRRKSDEKLKKKLIGKDGKAEAGGAPARAASPASAAEPAAGSSPASPRARRKRQPNTGARRSRRLRREQIHVDAAECERTFSGGRELRCWKI